MARKLEVQIVGDSRSLERAFSRASASGKRFDRSFATMGRGLATKFAAAGAAVAAIGGVASKSFSPFEESLDRIVGLVGVNREQVDQWSKALLRMGPAVGKGPGELANALYFITSAGIRGQKAMEALRVSAEASAAGLGDTQVVADAVTSAMNAYAKSGLTARRATDILVAAVREGKTEAASFAPTLGAVLPTAAALGISFDKVAGTMALLSKTGTDAAEAATQVQAVMSSLLSTSPKVVKGLASVGLSQAQLRKIAAGPGGLVAVFRTLDKAFGSNIEAMRGVIPNVRAFRPVMNALAQETSSVDKTLQSVTHSTGLTAQAFKAVSEGEAFKFRKALASLSAIGIRLGAAFSPVVKRVADATNKVLDTVASMLDKISAARTIRGKINVIWTGAQGVAKNAQNAISKAISKVDWGQVWQAAKGISEGLQARLEQTDFSALGRRIGAGFSDAAKVVLPKAKEIADRVAAAARAIDWESLGKSIGPGLAAALVTAFVSLTDPAFWARNWDLALAVAAVVFRARLLGLAGKLVKPFGRLGGTMVLALTAQVERLSPRVASAFLSLFTRLPALVGRALAPLTAAVGKQFARLGRIAQFAVRVLGVQAAINAVVRFATRARQVFGGLGDWIGGMFSRLWAALERQALAAALRIVEPFSHLPGRLGKWARDLKEKWQRQLYGVSADAETTASRVNRALTGIKDRTVKVTIQTVVSGERGGPSVAAASRIPQGAPPAVAGAAEQARKAAAASAAADAAQEAAAKKATAAKIAAAAAAKKAAAAAKAAAKKQRKAFDSLLAALQLGVQSAQVNTPRRIDDDIAATLKVQQAIQKQIKVEGRTTELMGQLLDVRSNLADLRQQQKERAANKRQATQFKALGLSATGDALTPTVKTLRKQLGNISGAVEGTFLDTKKTQSVLSRIRKVLSGGLGKVGDEVRAKVREILNGIDQQLKDHGRNRTKARPVTSAQLIAGLGLGEEQAKVLRSRLSKLGTGGVVASRPSAFGTPILTGGGGGLTITGPVTVVANDPEEFIRGMQRRARRDAAQTRGRSSGSILGVR